ncbi:class I SAM-dependent methyltransferase [Thermococcus sp. M39]|uniref:class I SAM-dependent methyltransferase n=1 Tax=unclassified Thermococcus TaxID=2627626 RepID=UPI00143989B0|nr:MULTISPECIES: class I SAM-dependent methyltransferase [unclassified Thermococcus]NJE07831.1 class I SAM-dependent methyltransferase [Thermococcus sp. M39]NJE13458.1 class I SAM-dependent methyltransferase [Thermococcus sp. LS2]
MSFRKYYQVFKVYSDINSPEYKKRIEELEPYLMRFLANKGKVLDLACGAGGFSFLLEDYGFEVIGVDIDEDMLKKAREYKKERGSNVVFVQADAKKLPFKDHSFDYVLFVGDNVVHFTPSELNQVFKEICRVLSKDGLFILHFNDLREMLPMLKSSNIVGEEYWISKVLVDKDEKFVILEYQGPNDYFRVKFNIWGKTAIELLAKLYFIQVESLKIGEYSYLQVYKPKKR